VWFTKITLLLWISVAVLIIFFLVAYRKPKLVPDKKQWLAESIYGFVRNNIAVDMIGKEGVRFAPYLASLFCFIFVMNLWGIIPFAQISPNSHIAFPAVLALISWVMFIYLGFKTHGIGYFKVALVPPAPWFILPILVPIEFFSNFIVRPFSLAVRLFANMFAGHMLLLVRDDQRKPLAGADLAAVLADDHRADVPGLRHHRAAGVRLHRADRELHPGLARQGPLSRRD
jgi:F-type H+-transporting ATPase subunit a